MYGKFPFSNHSQVMLRPFRWSVCSNSRVAHTCRCVACVRLADVESRVPGQRHYYGLNHLHYLTASAYRRARVFDSDRFRSHFVKTLGWRRPLPLTVCDLAQRLVAETKKLAESNTKSKTSPFGKSQTPQTEVCARPPRLFHLPCLPCDREGTIIKPLVRRLVKA
jgi:hypothetical protein